MKSHFVNILIVVFLCIVIPTSAAVTVDPNNLFDLSLEELMDVPIVVSASRYEQKIGDIPVPVSVITSEDIHYSGLTSIPEILQFSPGMDVLRLNRSYSAVGVRGLHDLVSDRTLTLVNGRSADSPIFGGSEFFRLPILMEDIDRIEITRGPGGAAWGANAFTGVINIITKKPEDLDGWFTSTTISEFGDTYSHLRYSFDKGPWDWKLSVGYNNTVNSDDAGAGKYHSYSNPIAESIIGYNSYEARDFSRNFILDIEALNQLTQDDKLRFGVAYSHVELGDFEYGGNYPMENNWHETLRAFSKLEHEYDNGDTSHLQWTGNFSSSDSVAAKWKTSENDLEMQYNLENLENHHLSIGGNFRHFYIDPISGNDFQVQFEEDSYNEYFAGLFLIDRMEITDSWSFESQFRTDWYSETDLDWSMRLSSLHSLNPDTNRNLRFSVAKAFRTPYATLREVSANTVPMDSLGFPGLYMINTVQADDLENEETWALEAGYSEQLTENVLIQVNAYYQYLDEMIGFAQLDDPLGLGRIFYQFDNLEDAQAYGGEIQLQTKFDFGTISAWYAYNDLQAEVSGQNMRAYGPAPHKVGINCRLHLDKKWTMNVNYRYSDTTPSFSPPAEPEMSHRLDLTWARKIADSNGEIMFGITDVFNNTNGPNIAMNQLTAHETPGRTFFARLQLNF